MTDVFFSYSSRDRERVRPVRDALAKQGFEVFWDQQVPAGVNWDTWIRQHLSKARCAIVLWSKASVASENVQHEATVAKQQGKLIPVLLEPLTAEQFPMGLYSVQCVDLRAWDGNPTDADWAKLRQQVEAKLTPLWVQRQLHELEAELVAERARREALEARDKALQAQIAKEAQAQIELKQLRDAALSEVASLNAKLEEMARGRADLERRAIELSERLVGAEAEKQALAISLDKAMAPSAKNRARGYFGLLGGVGAQEDKVSRNSEEPAQAVETPQTGLMTCQRCRGAGHVGSDDPLNTDSLRRAFPNGVPCPDCLGLGTMPMARSG